MKVASRRRLIVVDQGKPKPYSQRMIEIVDSQAGREAYAKRMGIGEPALLNRSTLRSLSKVTA